LPPKKQQELLAITEALDPLRLLQKLEHLQKALWRHAVKPEAAESQESSSTLPFSVNQCAEGKIPADSIAGPPPSLLKQERRRKYQKSGRPHDWRTRQDPFEGLWEEITSWLVARPELTTAEIFRELERLYPGRYRTTQARTLRRGGHSLRARLLVTFDDQWGEEIVNGHPQTPELRAEVLTGVS